MIKKDKKYFENGFSFIEILVGVSLLLIVAIGLYGAFQLSIRLVGQSKARITAAALANQQIETIKNMPYGQIGTFSGIPAGDIPETEIINRNNIDYTIKTTIGYVDDPFDETAPTDTLPNDYKSVKVKVSWSGFLGGEIFFVTNIAPKGLETSEGGGNLSISVFDALGAAIPQANLHIVNTEIDPNIDVSYQTNDQGKYLVAGAPSSTAAYQITATKDGYSVSRTYGVDEVTNPTQPHTTVIESKLTQISFSIDLLSAFSVQTFTPWGSGNFSDSFLDESKISELSDLLIDQGQADLASSTGYVSSGYLISNSIAPINLINWDKFFWTDIEPTDTEAKYQILYHDGVSWTPIPDSDLPNNSTCFISSPVDLSELSTTTYPQLKAKGVLSTNDASSTPSLFDWNISWITGESTPIGNISFNLRGNKTIGTDTEDQPVYKYSDDFATDSTGRLDILNLEWDAYNFTIAPAENLDLTGTNPTSDPFGQNIGLLPNTNQPISLFLKAENELLITFLNSETAEPIFNAQVRLYNIGLGYDQTQFTNEQGKTLFIPLEAGNYNIEIQADGFSSYSGNINVSGDKASIINLTPIGPS